MKDPKGFEKNLHTLLLRLNALRGHRLWRQGPSKNAIARDARVGYNPAPPPRKGQRAGQSLVELALFFPILLILLSGVVEFGFMLNTYVNLIDGPREAARFAVAQNPFTSVLVDKNSPPPDNPCFYSAVKAEVISALSPIQLDPSQDDVVISVFAINNGDTTQYGAITRYPAQANLPLPTNNQNPCPSGSVPGKGNKVGEWHLYGRGSGCTVGVDLDCHPSRFTSYEVLRREEQTNGGLMPPAMGVVLVEVYYSYHQVLKLPWLAFVGDPIRVYTYTMMPVPAAAPLVTPTP